MHENAGHLAGVHKLLQQRPSAQVPSKELEEDTTKGPNVERSRDLGSLHVALWWPIGWSPLNRVLGHVAPRVLAMEPAKAKVGDHQGTQLAWTPPIDKVQDVLGLDVAMPPVDLLLRHEELVFGPALSCRVQVNPLDRAGQTFGLLQDPGQGALVSFAWRIPPHGLPHLQKVRLCPAEDEAALVTTLIRN